MDSSQALDDTSVLWRFCRPQWRPGVHHRRRDRRRGSAAAVAAARALDLLVLQVKTKLYFLFCSVHRNSNLVCSFRFDSLEHFLIKELFPPFQEGPKADKGADGGAHSVPAIPGSRAVRRRPIRRDDARKDRDATQHASLRPHVLPHLRRW